MEASFLAVQDEHKGTLDHQLSIGDPHGNGVRGVGDFGDPRSALCQRAFHFRRLFRISLHGVGRGGVDCFLETSHSSLRSIPPLITRVPGTFLSHQSYVLSCMVRY